MKTSEDFFKEWSNNNGQGDIPSLLRRFATFHVKRALKKAGQVREIMSHPATTQIQQSIMKSYPVHKNVV